MATGLAGLDAMRKAPAAAAASSGTPASAGLEYLDQIAGRKPAAEAAPVPEAPAPAPRGNIVQDALAAVEGIFNKNQKKAGASGSKADPFAALDTMAGRTVPNDTEAKLEKGFKQPLAPGDNAFPGWAQAAGPSGAFGGTTSQTTPALPDENAEKMSELEAPVLSVLQGPVDRAKAVIQSVQQKSFDPLKKSFASETTKVNPFTGEPQNMDYLDPKKQALFEPRIINTLVAGFAGSHGAEGAEDAGALEAGIKNIAQSGNEEDIAGHLRTLGVPEAKVPSLAKEFVEMTDADKIRSTLKSVAESTPPPLKKGFEENPVAVPEEAPAEVPTQIDEKAAQAGDADEFAAALTPQETKIVVNAEGTDAHLDHTADVPEHLVPAEGMRGVFEDPDTGDLYFSDFDGNKVRIDATAAARDYFNQRGGEVNEPMTEGLPTEDETLAKNRSDIENQIRDLRTQVDIDKEVSGLDPARELLKYYGRNDPRYSNLDDIFSRNSGTGAKSGKLDDVVSELGFSDVQQAHDAVIAYLDHKERVQASKAALKDLYAKRKALPPKPKAAKPGQKLFQKPAEPVKRGLPNKAGLTPIGDYLRRRAQRVDVQERVDSRGLIQGDASTVSQQNAMLESTQGEIEKGPFKGWTQDLRNWYQRWIFGRQAAAAEVKISLKPLEQYREAWDKGGVNDLYKYEGSFAPEEPGRSLEGGAKKPDRTSPGFKKISDTLAEWLDEEQKAGVPVRERPGYLPLYLSDEAAGAGSIGGRQVGLRPGFTMARQFDTYAEAIAAGKTPRYTSLFDVMQARARAHFKAMADAKFFNEGASRGWIVPKTAVDETVQGAFRDLDSERFPARRAAYGNTVYNGVYTAPEGVAQKINNYLRDPNKYLKTIADAVNTAKGAVMSVGVPGTAINPHLFNILPREIFTDLSISPTSAPRELARFTLYTLYPKAARAYVEANLERAMPLFRNGMHFSAEGMSTKELAPTDFSKAADGSFKESLLSKVSRTAKRLSQNLHNIFGGNMFGGLIPARKIYNGLRVMDAYKKSGLSADDAARRAADDMNIMYGGMNWESLGRSKDWQNFLRSTVFAPDYAESGIRLGARAIKGALKPGSKEFNLYGRFMYWFAGAYLAANIINYENSGHWMYGNDPLHQFDIAAGKDMQGKTRYLKIFGTGVDFIRFPVQFAAALLQGKGDEAVASIRDRLSTGLGPVLSLLSNTDYRGDPIFGADKYGRPQGTGQQAVNFFNNTLGAEFPGSVTSLVNYAAGKSSLEQTVEQGAGLPVSYKNEQPTMGEIDQLKDQAKTDIKNGDYRLFNELVKTGAIAARSKSAFIRDALQGPSARQTASSAKTKAKNAQIKKNVQAAGL